MRAVFKRIPRQNLKDLLTLLVVYFFVTVAFGLIYFLLPANAFKAPFDSSADGVLDSVYFSFVTTTTLGYGDHYPTQALARSIVIVQLLLSLFLLGVALNYLLSTISSSRR